MRGWTKYFAVGIAVLAIVLGVVLSPGKNSLSPSQKQTKITPLTGPASKTQSTQSTVNPPVIPAHVTQKVKPHNPAVFVPKTHTHSTAVTLKPANQVVPSAPASSSGSSHSTITSGNSSSAVVAKTATHPLPSSNSTNSSPAQSTPAVENSSTANSTSTPPSEGTFTVIVSHEHQVVEKKTLAIFAGESLMDEMRQNFIIQTAYGGGFMVSIEGVKSQWTGVAMADRKPVDWFLYVNGQEPPIGADSIFPHPGDVDIWDYHAWDPSTGRG